MNELSIRALLKDYGTELGLRMVAGQAGLDRIINNSDTHRPGMALTGFVELFTVDQMQILGNTKSFFDTQSYIQDTNVTEYLNKTIDDQYGMLFDMAQGQIMDDMVNSQWQKSQ